MDVILLRVRNYDLTDLPRRKLCRHDKCLSDPFGFRYFLFA